MSAINQNDLKTFGLNDRLINRVLTQFGKDIPEPPVAMLGFVEEGEYHAINEFYAMKLLLAQGIHPAVSKVRGIIGGTTQTVNDNIKTLRAELPKGTFDRSNNEPIDDPTTKFKRDLVKIERDLFEIELNEADERHAEEMVRMEQVHDIAIRTLEAKLHEAIGRNMEMGNLLKEAQTKAEEAQIKLKDTAVDQRALNDALATIDTLKSELASKTRHIEQLFAVNETTATANTKRFDELTTQYKQAQSQLQLLLLDLEEKNRIIKRYQDSNATVIEERDHYRSQSADLQHQLDQAQLALKHEDELANTVAGIKSLLEPLNGIDAIAQQQAGTTNGMKAIERAIQDMSTNMLNLSASLRKDK